MNSPHFNGWCHLLNRERNSWTYFARVTSVNCCAHSNSQLSIRSYTHFVPLYPNLLSHIICTHWTKTSLKLSSFAALQTRGPTAQVQLQAASSMGCAHQDWHPSRHQWKTVTGAIPGCAPLQQPQGQEPPSWGELQPPPSGTEGGRSTWGPQAHSLFSKCHWFTLWLGKVTMPCSIAVSSSSKSGGQHASPIRSCIHPSTGLTLLLLCNSKKRVSENISQFFAALNYIIVTSSCCLKQPYRWMK